MTVTTEAFPFDHFTLRDADAINVMREKLSDEEVLAAFQNQPDLKERLAAFMLRNARPERAAA